MIKLFKLSAAKLVYIEGIQDDGKKRATLALGGSKALEILGTGEVNNLKLLEGLHPGRLTWKLQITHFEGKMIFQTSMILFHVNLQGCRWWQLKYVLFSIRTMGK